MANRLDNIAGLFKDSRTRAIVLITLVVLLFAIIVGILSVRGKTKGVQSEAVVTEAPGNIQSVPFEAPNEEYARLQKQQNTQQAQQAEQTGTSAIPTIFRSGKESGEVPPGAAAADQGVGFTALSREQSDAGTFAAKEFNVGGTQSCPTPDTQCGISPLGEPVYDANGRLIGYADANGKVRDGVTGNIIGVVGPDGVVRDLSGKSIAQKSLPIVGTPVYDEKGNVIGTVDADGKMRDPTGKLLTNGKPGVPVYDKNGNLIGYAGPDGKVRDLTGKVIGTVGPDGVVRDTNGNIMGKAGAISPGTPIYDANGNVIGTLGPDGKVRDANGNIIGIMGVEGKVRDANGNIVGNLTKPEPKAAPASGSEKLEVKEAAAEKIGQTDARRSEILNDQKYSQIIQQKQQAMTTQATQLLVAWGPPSQQYVQGELNDQNAQGTQETSGNRINVQVGERGAGQSAAAASGPILIKAGTVYFGVINTAINSDEPGPVMATIIDGPYKGGKLLGGITFQKKAVLISFNTLTMPTYSKSIKVNAFAIDQNTARTGIATEVDNHYLLRYGSVFAAAFVQGYGQALTQAGSTTSTTGLSVQTTSPDLSPQQKFYVALGNVGSQFNNQAAQIFNTQPTVHVASGTAVGILFMDDVQLS